jgi:hypothetical protein
VANVARQGPGAQASGAAPGADDADAPWRYRLQTPVPPYWIPLVPERPDPGSAAVLLRRARMRRKRPGRGERGSGLQYDKVLRT